MPSERLKSQMEVEEAALQRIFNAIPPAKRGQLFQEMQLLEVGLKIGWTGRILLEQMGPWLKQSAAMPAEWRHTLGTVLGDDLPEGKIV